MANLPQLAAAGLSIKYLIELTDFCVVAEWTNVNGFENSKVFFARSRKKSFDLDYTIFQPQSGIIL